MPRPRICEDETAARQFLENLRWPDGPVCPDCAAPRPVLLPPRLFHCSACRRQYSVTVGTIFSSSHIPLCKWLRALHFLCNRDEGATAVMLQHELELRTYKSAWAMASRLRWALTRPPFKGLLPSAPHRNSRKPLRIALPFRETAKALLAVSPEPRTAPQGDRPAGAKPERKAKALSKKRRVIKRVKTR